MLVTVKNKDKKIANLLTKLSSTSITLKVNEEKENPTWKALGYPGPDPAHTNNNNSVDQSNMTGPLQKALVYMESPRDTLSSALSQAGLSLTTQAHPKRRDKKSILTIQCDAVVVGSGSGGGVVAGLLTQAGYKVVVLEKGNYHARSNLSLLEGEAMAKMYQENGLLATEDTGVVILAGSTVGGGSAINWSASLRTPEHVISEWRNEHGIELFGSDAYAQALDAVCRRMEVQSECDEENLNNSVLRRGCRELGYPVKNIPRNSPRDHYCGWCCFGCKDGRKKGTAETWLVDMVHSGNGVVLPGCRGTMVLHADIGRKRNVATGVMFEYENGWSEEKETCIVQSKVTVVACGALSTPVLLKRSGLKNPNIGKNLHLHPVVMVWGYFPESAEKGKKSYEGGIMTAMSPVVYNARTTGYGAMIQTPQLHPGMFSALMPWISGLDFKERMRRFANTAHIFALARDKGSGSVDSSGSIKYKMDASDEDNLKKGVEKMLRIVTVAGAAEIGTHHCRGPRLDVKKASSHAFEKFVKKESARGISDYSTPVCSAHQMGSCRMGVNPRTSAVGPNGETWEVEGLYVADSSVFPTALGVNPMVTVQAIAYCTAQTVMEELRRKIRRNRRSSGNSRRYVG